MRDQNRDQCYHGQNDMESSALTAARAVGVHAGKRVTIKERDISYQFYLHFHPYVQQLMQKLLSDSTRGLLDADTDYEPDGETLPGSIEIYLAEGTGIEVYREQKIALLDGVRVSVNGQNVELSGNMELELREAATVTLTKSDDENTKGGVRAVLLDGMNLEEKEGELILLDNDMDAMVYANAKITLSKPASIKLYDGTPTTIRIGTTVLLLAGTKISIPRNTKAELRKKKARPKLFAKFFDQYKPSDLVKPPYPVKDLDFTTSGAYSVYNWELFFHVPFTIAIHLSKNHRFAEAQQWFHFLFDPTDDSDGPTPERFWKVRPFQYTDVRKIEEILINLSTGADPILKKDTENSILKLRQKPFRPHVIARYRQQAYMYKTVMAYLDNLVAWGDSLFRQDTGEAIDEAMMLYVLAANILGPRPQAVPKKGSVRPQTYAVLRPTIDKLGNAMRDLELALPFDEMQFSDEGSGGEKGLASILSLGQTLYFCAPRNDKLLSYWDTVADRLFKIRNSLNIQGTFRQLALFEPPIDPAMLARAVAAGLDIGAIVNGLNQPLPLVRFQLLVQKAAEIVQEVKSLGNNLLSAMEKEDGEAMAILRARHESAVMKMVEQVKYAQLQEATKSKEGLFKSLSLAIQRYTYYERQLGRKPEEIEKSIPELIELDRGLLEKIKFVSYEPVIETSDIEYNISQELGASGGKIISVHEAKEMESLTSAHAKERDAADQDRAGIKLSHIPDIGISVQPIGVGGTSTNLGGGSTLSKMRQHAASTDRSEASQLTFEANKVAKIGSYTEREKDWTFQSNLAAGEITQTFKQIRAAEIREAIADLELKNHRQQMKHAEEIEHFLNEEGAEKKGKKTNKSLYAWMKREVKGLYGQSFQFAFDIAKKAERALQHELGNPELSYLQFGYLAGKEGLLAGEKLYLDIKRMEMAYHDLNQREYELTKHVSLLQINPLALIQLRMTGRCVVELPEALFDMDGPGHFFRRIKSVAVSIPCITGPYAGVNCTLTLLKSSIRKTPVLQDGLYERKDAEDERFDSYYGSLQSIVTSSAQNDSGLFETNLRDERYLPFENSGVISEWQLQLPANPSVGDPCQFDYGTISDVILHIRYTAREGGGLLRNGALSHVKELITEAKAVGSVRLFSVRHEFPNEWANFKSATTLNERHALLLNLREEHYPFWSKGKLSSITQIEILAKSAKTPVPGILVIFDENTDEYCNLAKDAALGGLLMGKRIENLPSPVTAMKLYFDDNVISDLWLAVTWSSE